MPGLIFALVVFAIFFSRAFNGPPEAQGQRAVWVLRNAETWRFLGLFILICATAFYIWGRRGIVMASLPTDKVVAVADFSANDLTGPLDEVLIDGYFRPDQAIEVAFPRNIAFLSPVTLLIPVTGADWKVGDPVRLYVMPSWYGYGTEGQDLIDGRLKEGFPPQGSGPVRQTRLLAKAKLAAFVGDVTDTLAKAGLPTDGPVQILRINERGRARALEQAFMGSKSLAIVFAVLGAALVGASYLARRYGRRISG